MRAALLTAVVLCGACAGGDDAANDTGAQEANVVTENPEFAPALGVDLGSMTKSASGLYVQDTQAGTGEALTAGRTAVVQYTGWLPDGSKFDSSLDAGQPFEVVVGQGQVIQGWDEGLQGMKVGGKRKLVIPPALAYGERGAGGVIPPNATLVFEVELLAVR